MMLDMVGPVIYMIYVDWLSVWAQATPTTYKYWVERNKEKAIGCYIPQKGAYICFAGSLEWNAMKYFVCYDDKDVKLLLLHCKFPDKEC